MHRDPPAANESRSKRTLDTWLLCDVTQLRKELAQRSLASATAHKEAVAAVDRELQRLEDSAIEVIRLGRSEEDLEAQLSALRAEASELERLIQAEQHASDEKIKATTEATEEVERTNRSQRDTMRADIIQTEEHFRKEEL